MRCYLYHASKFFTRVFIAPPSDRWSNVSIRISRCNQIVGQQISNAVDLVNLFKGNRAARTILKAEFDLRAFNSI
jgi:hypothetical protein